MFYQNRFKRPWEPEAVVIYFMSGNKIHYLCSLPKDSNILTSPSDHHLQTGIALRLCVGNRVPAELLLKHVSKQCNELISLTVNIPQKNLQTVKYLVEVIANLYYIIIFLSMVTLMAAKFYSSSQTQH